MSTTTLSQRLRDLKRNALYVTPEQFDDLIAQAEAQEAQAGELSDEVPPIPSMQEVIDNCEAPSQAIGEQTPVGWMNGPEEKEGCITAQRKSLWESNGNELFAQQYTIPLYRSPISPEARDRAIEALDQSLVVWNDGDDKLVRMYINQALSALRGS